MGAFPPHDEEIHFLWRSSSTTLSFQRCLLCEILFRWIVARGWNRQCNHPLQYRTANKVNVSGSYHGVRRRNNTTLPPSFLLGSEQEGRAANHARSVTISPDNKFLVAGSEDKYIRVR